MKKIIYILITLLISIGIIIYTDYEYKEYLEHMSHIYQGYFDECTEEDECEAYKADLDVLKETKYPGNNFETFFNILGKTDFLLIMITGGIILVIFPLINTKGKYSKYYPYYLIIPILFLIVYFISYKYTYYNRKAFTPLIPYLLSLLLIGHSYFNIGLIVKHIKGIFFQVLSIYGIYISCLLLSGILSELFKVSLKINSIYAIDNYDKLLNMGSYLYGTLFFSIITTILTLWFYKFNKIKHF